MFTPHNPLGRSSSPDDDPTGVRALLSSLPDPGPMPPELVQRITASLAEEERARRERQGALAGVASGAATTRPGEPDPGGEHSAYGSEHEVATVSPFVRRKRRRQVFGGIAGAAAAVAVGLAVGTYVNPGGSSAGSSVAGGAVSSARSSLSGGERANGGSGSAGSTAGSSGGQARSHAQGLGPEQQLSVVSIQQSGRDYRAATFATQAAALAAAATKPGASHLAPHADTGSAGRIGTPAGLAECLDGLGVHPSTAHPAVADLARYAGKPAVVLVVPSAAGSGGASGPGASGGSGGAGPSSKAGASSGSAGPERAWAVGRDCSATDPHVLHGPVTLP